VLLQTIPGGHFNMAENRTFLLCVDSAVNAGDIEFRTTRLSKPLVYLSAGRMHPIRSKLVGYSVGQIAATGYSYDPDASTRSGSIANPE